MLLETRVATTALTLLAALALAPSAFTAPAPAKPTGGKPATPPAPNAKIDPRTIGPEAPYAKAAVTHAPYEAGDCSICHEKNDPKNPGKIKTATPNELCLGCHDQIADLVKRKYKHAAAEQNCLLCHNSHNSPERKLLKQKPDRICFACHKDIEKITLESKVKHEAVTAGEGCANCHNAHGSDVEKILIGLPFDLCVNCHSKDNMVDGEGKKLVNFKKWLDENPVWHAPVEAKDCSACHTPHGSAHFRLLVEDYPSKFYAPYDPKNYALCYRCHNDQILAQARTTALTGFRDNDANLHFLHVNKQNNGRTCRACHEVHASKQPHHIRDAVPYGSSGWQLKVNFQAMPDGGQCEKTCHSTRRYVNGAAAAPVKKEAAKGKK